VKKLVEGLPEDEEDEAHHHHEGSDRDRDLELNRHSLDEGSDDDAASDDQSMDALEEKWSELEVGDTSVPHAAALNAARLGNRRSTSCRCSRSCSLY